MFIEDTILHRSIDNMFVEFQFIEDEQGNDHERGDADGHPTNVDEGEQLIFQQVPESDL